jgi:hypothetical protein
MQVHVSTSDFDGFVALPEGSRYSELLAILSATGKLDPRTDISLSPRAPTVVIGEEHMGDAALRSRVLLDGERVAIMLFFGDGPRVLGPVVGMVFTDCDGLHYTGARAVQTVKPGHPTSYDYWDGAIAALAPLAVGESARGFTRVA